MIVTPFTTTALPPLARPCISASGLTSLRLATSTAKHAAHSPFLSEKQPDARPIQGLLYHKDVTTSMIFTHVLNPGWKGVRCPADRL